MERTDRWMGGSGLTVGYVVRIERGARRVRGIVFINTLLPSTLKGPEGFCDRRSNQTWPSFTSVVVVRVGYDNINTWLSCREYVRSVEHERIISEEEGKVRLGGRDDRHGDRRSAVDGRRPGPLGPAGGGAAWSRIRGLDGSAATVVVHPI